jgi:hypothetical protein
MSQSTELCARCHISAPVSRKKHCGQCIKEFINAFGAEPCSRCHQAPREVISYCRPCHRMLAAESRDRVGGKKPLVDCSRCGKERDGKHPTYCKECYALYRKGRLGLPCSRCGKQRKPEDKTNSSYCYDCWRDWWMLRKYGITQDEYDLMLADQDNKCALCRCAANGRTWHVDHCHVTNKRRKILCDNCNFGLGHFKDNPVVLRAAADYVEAHAAITV